MKLLKLTFEQSRKVVDSRKDIFADDNAEKRNLTLWNRLVGIAATGAFIIMVMALGLGPAETAVDSHGDYLISMDTALASQLVSMYIYTPLLWLVKALGIYTVIYFLMPFPNILVQRVLGLPFFFSFTWRPC